MKVGDVFVLKAFSGNWQPVSGRPARESLVRRITRYTWLKAALHLIP